MPRDSLLPDPWPLPSSVPLRPVSTQEDWEADDDAPAKPEPKTAAAPKKKAAPAPAAKKVDAPPANETEAERRQRLQKAVELADLQNAAELFGGARRGASLRPPNPRFLA